MSVGTLDVARHKTDNQPVKLEADVWRKAKIIAASRGVAISEYVSELLRPLVESDYPKALAKLNEDLAREQSDSPAEPPPGRRPRKPSG